MQTKQRKTTRRKASSKRTTRIKQPPVPKSVAIVAMGASCANFVSNSVALGTSRRVADEIWGINSVGGTIKCDRMFVMDDLEHILKPLADATPGCMTAGMFTWLKDFAGPVYTSTVYPGFDNLVEYPLEDVINTICLPYLNSSVAYAFAYAIHIGVKQVGLYGCDFSYPDRHIAERGRACVEFLIGLAGSRGISIIVASESTLLDANEPITSRVYGYHEPFEIERVEEEADGEMISRLKVKPVVKDEVNDIRSVSQRTSNNGDGRVGDSVHASRDGSHRSSDIRDESRRVSNHC